MDRCQRTGRFPSGDRLPLTTILGLAFMVLWAQNADALPRYTAQYGQNCNLCHVNPTGGGMRSQYASQYIVPEEIAARGWGDTEIENYSPQITPNIAVGVDLRTLIFQREGGTGSTFAMQGDFYLDVTLNPYFTAYVEQGLSTSGEIFGMGRTTWLDGYFKAGRFIPDYGWRFSDHQMFNRRYELESSGSDSPASLYGSGIEVGMSPGILTASASLLGGSQKNGDNYAARAMIQESLGELNFGVGGSLLRRQFADGHHRIAGGFWYLAYGPVTWLGEIDETSQPGVLGNLVSQELVYQVSRGYDVRLTYNFQDPDRAYKSGTRQEYGIGLSTMPAPFISILAMANYWDLDPGPAVTGDDYLEGQLMVHFFY